MKKVITVGGYEMGKTGVATIIYRWAMEIKRTELIYDFISPRGLPDEQYLTNLKQKNVKFYAPERRLNIIQKLCWVYSTLKSNQYDIIHINVSVSYSAFVYMAIAKLAGINKVAIHSHCSEIDDNSSIKRVIKTFLHYMLRPYVRKNSNVWFTCSKEAAEWMYGKRNIDNSKLQVVFNGLQVDKFFYNLDYRVEHRNKLGIKDNEIVLGNIGRFFYQKNHRFLIEIFGKIQRKIPNVKLLLIGSGELEQEVKKQVNVLGIKDNVIFAGQRKDANELLSVMDVFLLPSLFEGLPLVLTEAQVAGLPCVVSSTVSQEAKLTEQMEFVDLKKYDKWMEAIQRAMSKGRYQLDASILDKLSISESTKQLVNTFNAM